MHNIHASSSNASATQPAQWAAHEFAQSVLPDRRLRKRLHRIATAFAQKPTASIPLACASWAEAKGAYRFFQNDSIAPDSLRQGHHQAPLDRVAAHPVVLAIQDTTALNYSTHPGTQGLGPLGSHSAKTIGLRLHSTLALSPEGQPLGWLHNRVRARRGSRQAAPRHRRKLTHKESYKWLDSLSACQALATQCPQTQLVNVCDREGDLYDLFVQALEASVQPPVHVLVRARHERKLVDGDRPLWEQVARQKVGATLSVKVGRRGEHPCRLAKLQIRFCSVCLEAPSRKTNQPPIQLWAIEARERRAPRGRAPILWRLLTTLPVSSVEQAVEKGVWYAQRWQIEVLHKVLKSGCQVEQRQLGSAERLERALAVDLVVAWRVLALCKAAREQPQAPISDWLSQAQWQALWCYRHQRTTPPQTPPPTRQAVRWIAQLGGFLARKSDGEPGAQCLWRGLHQLDAMTDMWQLCRTTIHKQKSG